MSCPRCGSRRNHLNALGQGICPRDIDTMLEKFSADLAKAVGDEQAQASPKGESRMGRPARRGRRP